MKGFQITFYTLHNRRHRGQQMHEWLMQAAEAQGTSGSTVVEAAEGHDHTGKFHAMHLFNLTDQPMEITMAMEARQVEQFFRLLEQEDVNLFYVKTAVEFGIVGSTDGHQSPWRCSRIADSALLLLRSPHRGAGQRPRLRIIRHEPRQ